MALASLLQWDSVEIQDPMFAFEHFWSHQRILSSSQEHQMHPGASDVPMWHRNHQQAHWDMDTTAGIGLAYNIEDYTLAHKAQRQWWLFQNHYAHLTAGR